MALPAFDTLRIANRLKAVGVPSAQAEAEAEVLSEVFEVNLKELATKEDLRATKEDLRREIGDLRKDMDAKFAGVDAKFAGVDAKLAAMKSALTPSTNRCARIWTPSTNRCARTWSLWLLALKAAPDFGRDVRLHHPVRPKCPQYLAAAVPMMHKISPVLLSHSQRAALRI